MLYLAGTKRWSSRCYVKEVLLRAGDQPYMNHENVFRLKIYTFPVQPMRAKHTYVERKSNNLRTQFYHSTIRLPNIAKYCAHTNMFLYMTIERERKEEFDPGAFTSAGFTFFAIENIHY